MRHFANDLGKRLRTPEYQKFFSRFVRRRDAQGFFQTVRERYRGLSDLANAALDEHALAYPQDLFGSLASARIEHIMDDAAMIAVPVAQLDREVQRAHDERLNAEGWALLNLAGFFVPGIGMALLAVSAWELLGEAFHGIEAWHEGDTSEALDHLLNVARDVALVGVSAVGATVASRLWNRSAVVDSLVPARLEGARRSCGTRTWQPTAVKPCRPGLCAMRPVCTSCRDARGSRWMAITTRCARASRTASGICCRHGA